MYQRYRDGWIETISGCMFAGKTEELIRRIKVLEFAKKEILVFKPKIDDRYSDTMVVSHAGSSVESIVIEDAIEILEHVKDTTQVVAIDEAQFFGNNICAVCNELADSGIRVMAASIGFIINIITATLIIMMTFVIRSGRAWAIRTSRSLVSLTIRLINSPVCLS